MVEPILESSLKMSKAFSYFTAGNTVRVFTPYAQRLGKIKIPKGNGTNLAFGGGDRFQRTLFITTWNAVYAVDTPFGAK